MVSGQSYNSIFIYYIIGGNAYLGFEAICKLYHYHPFHFHSFLSSLIRLSLSESINATTSPHHHNTNNTTSWVQTNTNLVQESQTMDWHDECRDKDKISGHYCPFIKILI